MRYIRYHSTNMKWVKENSENEREYICTLISGSNGHPDVFLFRYHTRIYSMNSNFNFIVDWHVACVRMNEWVCFYFDEVEEDKINKKYDITKWVGFIRWAEFFGLLFPYWIYNNNILRPVAFFGLHTFIHIRRSKKIYIYTGLTRICRSDDFLSYHVSAIKFESVDVLELTMGRIYYNILNPYLILEKSQLSFMAQKWAAILKIKNFPIRPIVNSSTSKLSNFIAETW